MKPRMTDVVLPPTFEQTANAGTSTQNIGQVVSEKGQVLSETENKGGAQTAGPWRSQGWVPTWAYIPVHDARHNLVASLYPNEHRGYSRAEVESNASLIAAAPGLLAALAGIVDLQGKSAGGFPLSESELREWSVANHKARAAIAAAKGGAA